MSDSPVKEISDRGRSRTRGDNGNGNVIYAHRCGRSPSPFHLEKVAYTLPSREKAILVPMDHEDSQTEMSSTTDGNDLMEILNAAGTSNASNNVPSVLKVTTQSQSIAVAYQQGGSKPVAFTEVCVHLHQMILGDNPAVTRGAPVTMDWKIMSADYLSLDAYEAQKEKLPHKTMAQLRMGQVRRENIAKLSGYTKEEIAEAIETVNAIRKSRREGLPCSKDKGTTETKQVKRVGGGKLPKWVSTILGVKQQS